MPENKLSQLFFQKGSFGVFFVILMYYGFSRLSLIFRYGDIAFGYDTGIYRRVVIDHGTAASLSDHPAFAFGALTRVFSKIGFSADTILYGGYIAIALGILALLYTVIKKQTNTPLALCASLLFATSIMHFDFFAWYYYRNMIAIFCFLLALYLMQKKSHTVSLTLLCLASVHPLSAIPMFLTFGVYGLVKKEYRTFLLGHLSLSTLLAIALNAQEFARYTHIFFEYTGRVTSTPAVVGQELDGQFITLSEYLRTSLVYIPFGLLGIIKFGKKHLFWTIFFLMNTFLILLQLLLYKRFFVLLDFSIIFFASLYLLHLYTYIQTEAWRYVPATIFCLYLIIPYTAYVQQYTPTLHPTVFAEIEQIDRHIPQQSHLISVSTATAPWLLGFTADHTIIAPGMFDDNLWNQTEWHTFRSTTETSKRHALLNIYGAQTIYIFLADARIAQLLADDPNIVSLSPMLLRYEQ